MEISSDRHRDVLTQGTGPMRTLAVGVGVGLLVGLVVGGTLGRVVMRILFLARNQDDFALLPVTVSLILIVVSVALTAAPVPWLVERFAPDRDRAPGRLARGVVIFGLLGFALFAVTGVVTAYSVL